MKGELLTAAWVIAGGLLLSNPNLNSLGNIVAFGMMLIPTIAFVVASKSSTK